MSKHLVQNLRTTSTQVVDPATGDSVQVQPRSAALVHGRFVHHLGSGVRHRADHTRPLRSVRREDAAEPAAPVEPQKAQNLNEGGDATREHGPETVVTDNAGGGVAGTTVQAEADKDPTLSTK